MSRIIHLLAAALWLTVPAALLSHDASKHKGKPVDGEVVSVAADRFELKTATGTMPVTFSAKTKFEHGDAAVDKSHLSKGQRVKVFGTKLPSGEMAAREVLLNVDAGADKKKEKNDHKH